MTSNIETPSTSIPSTATDPTEAGPDADLSPGRHRAAPPAMSEEAVERLRSVASDDPVPLPEGRVGCAACGIAVPPPASRAAVIYADIYATGSSGALTPKGRGDRRVPLGLCQTCSERASRALALSTAHPRLVAALGPHRAIEAAEGVLVALDLLAAHGEAAAVLDVDDTRLGILVRNLGSVGLGLRWQAHVRARHLIDQANPYPWAHVRASDRLHLRTAHVRAFADRLRLRRGPVKVPPPEFSPEDVGRGQHPVAGGCGICGIGQVAVAPERAPVSLQSRLGHDLWSLHNGVAPQSLGAGGSPVTLTIWLCPSCEDAFQWEGSMGPSTMERALFAYLATLGQKPPHMEVQGLIGWAGLHADARRRDRPVPEPNALPFDHLDLSSFTTPTTSVLDPATVQAQVEAEVVAASASESV